MPDDDAQYYRDRKLAALAMSQAASDPAVRNIHRDLASRYDALATDPAETALDVAASGGNIEIATPDGTVTSLTPEAAARTSDRLLARARDAEKQTPASTAISRSTREIARPRLSLPTHRQEKP